MHGTREKFKGQDASPRGRGTLGSLCTKRSAGRQPWIVALSVHWLF